MTKIKTGPRDKPINKILAVYKPKGPTSNEVLDKIKKILGLRKRVGHAGTLDPLAKGVLVVGIGKKATKQLKDVVVSEKEYVAAIRLGMESATDDAEGEKKKIEASKIPSLQEIKEMVKKFEGKIFQVPPVYSAVKVEGQEAYKLARRGKLVSLKPRKVEIKRIEILKYKWPFLELKVVTGPGVYIRSLAKDIGRKLKTGGYLYELERTRVGKFTKEKALKLSQLEKEFC
jgi:tRNA pseudouridine55 synthase